MYFDFFGVITATEKCAFIYLCIYLTLNIYLLYSTPFTFRLIIAKQNMY